MDELPFAYQGSTANSTGIKLGSQTLSCSLVQPFSKGVWYVGEVFSSVACVTISTAGSRFNTVIAVYSGSCTNLECVTENDDISTLVRSSEVSWTALRGIQYYVYVGGVDSTEESGEFLVSGTVSALFCFVFYGSTLLTAYSFNFVLRTVGRGSSVSRLIIGPDFNIHF